MNKIQKNNKIIIAIITPIKNKPSKKTITNAKGSKTEIKTLQTKLILLLFILKFPNLKKIQITATNKKYTKIAQIVLILRKK